MRFASRANRDSGSGLSGILSGTRSDRIPLPRTDAGGLRDVDAARPAEQPIGAF